MNSFKLRLRTFKSSLLSLIDEAIVNCRWLIYRHCRSRTPMDARVIVSLTSYPKRFDALLPTLKTILLQSVRPEKVILWIANEDINALPAKVRELERYGLEIQLCEDLASYKKLIPTLGSFGTYAIVTADDDVVYWRDWLRDLLREYDQSNPEVLCHRMHEIRLDCVGNPLPYVEWHRCSENLVSHALNFATGMGGILYPPNVLHDRVADLEMMMKICPRGDDIWFYWMTRLNGVRVRKVASSGKFRFWRGSQDVALWKTNIENHENDVQIAAMVTKFGFPSGGQK
jgi:hypothetical protein